VSKSYRISHPPTVVSGIESRYASNGCKVALLGPLEIPAGSSSMSKCPLVCKICDERVSSSGGENGKSAICGFCLVLLTSSDSLIKELVKVVKATYRENQELYKTDPTNPFKSVMP
jgi:hypothetical protein